MFFFLVKVEAWFEPLNQVPPYEITENSDFESCLFLNNKVTQKDP